MICFQIVFYRSLKHLGTQKEFFFFSCDLLSNCILSIFETPKKVRRNSLLRLWFAFKLYFIDLWNTVYTNLHRKFTVVICFQIVFYRSLKHLVWLETLKNWCCDLLSNCILSIFETPAWLPFPPRRLLWFAFKLYFIDLWNTYFCKWVVGAIVVICFQIVFYRSLKHPARKKAFEYFSCDLLSNCILSIFETPWRWGGTRTWTLWFAFKLYFIDLWNTPGENSISFKMVVICFQIVFYRSLKHLLIGCLYGTVRCDLLSNCILSIFETPTLQWELNL